MTIRLLKDCPQYGRKWAKDRIIEDVYGPDARRMIEDGEAEEYSANVLVQKAIAKPVAAKPKTEPTTGEA